ncbi:FMRFamide receptor-like [Brachionus plicatilis]|uniref:FMRFamide receptor-like n=1 Tax=Brachionus plicatilis TaxID=10195 RepID=A0A3M7PKF4_BRAPC|nr:FMRFamide receptor-like [Brachionus plicatilis]
MKSAKLDMFPLLFSSNHSNSLFEDEEERYPTNQLSTILLSIIITVGVVGNSFNIIVFSKKKMRQGSTFRFLLYLSIADLLVLLVCSSEALARFGFQIEIRSYSLFICKLHTFLTYFLTQISSVILMVISIDRALVITNKNLVPFCFKTSKNQKKTSSLISFDRSNIYSHKFQFNCLISENLHRVDLVILFIMLFLAILNVHYFFFIDLSLKSDIMGDFEPKMVQIRANNSIENSSKKIILLPFRDETMYICFPLPHSLYSYFLNYIWLWIDICVYSLVPFIVMSVCSSIILIRIHKKSKNYFNHLINKNSECQKSNFYKRLRRNRQLLYMLLLTNFYFLLSQLPYCILFVLYKGKTSDNSFGQPLVHFLLYSNNAINFLLYGLSSQRYREELFGMCFKKSRKRNSTENKYLSVALQTNMNE